MKTQICWFYIIKIAVSLVVILSVISCSVQNFHNNNRKTLKKYYVLEVKNTTEDTLKFPHLIFQDFDICPNVQIQTKDMSYTLMVDLDLVHYVGEAQKEIVKDARLYYWTNEVPPASIGYFYFPKCTLLSTENFFDNLFKSKLLIVNVNEAKFEIPVYTLQKVKATLKTTVAY